MKICNEMKAADVADSFVRLVRNLATGDWFTSRISACGLFATAYKKLRDDGYNGTDTAELRRLFVQLCDDDTPMVRRAVSSNFGTFSLEVEKEHLVSELLPLFTKLSQDDQDSVRLLAVDNCVKIAGLLGDEESGVVETTAAWRKGFWK